MILPYPCSRILTYAGLVTLYAASRCTALTSCHSDGPIFARVLSRRIPALFMTMSMRPKASNALPTIAAPPSEVATES